MRQLALLAAAVLVILGLVQPGEKRLRQALPKYVPPPTKTSDNAASAALPPLKKSIPPVSLPPVASQSPLPTPVVLPKTDDTPIPANSPEVGGPPTPSSSPPAIPEQAPVREAGSEPQQDSQSTEVATEKPGAIEIQDVPEYGGAKVEPTTSDPSGTPSEGMFKVNSTRLNVRLEASSKSKKVGELVSGETVTAIDSLYGNEADGWINITARNGTIAGWVKKSYLTALP